VNARDQLIREQTPKIHNGVRMTPGIPLLASFHVDGGEKVQIPNDHLAASSQVKLLEDHMHTIPDGAWRDTQLRGDLSVGTAFGKRLRYLTLPGCQALRRISVSPCHFENPLVNNG